SWKAATNGRYCPANSTARTTTSCCTQSHVSRRTPDPRGLAALAELQVDRRHRHKCGIALVPLRQIQPIRQPEQAFHDQKPDIRGNKRAAAAFRPLLIPVPGEKNRRLS